MPRRARRVRLLVLAGVNALIVIHAVLYYVLGNRAVGCIDFFGLATFAGLGRVTAGSVFLGAIIILSLVMGRVFCGWGCHFALFQDLLVSLFDRLNFRVPFRRSRLEFVIPPILLAVTLFYPIVAWWRVHGVPQRVSADLAYPEVWHLLPGVKGVVLILGIDVIALTLLFGSRAFCRYMCPYGLFLKFFHAAAPLRVIKSGDCSGCGQCARACPTGVPIKREIETFGLVRDLNCMNCGDCVAACPSGALSMRFTRSAYSRVVSRGTPWAGQRPWIEVVLFALTVIGLVIFRGKEFGDFLSAGLGLMTGGLAVAAISPARFNWPRRNPFENTRLRFGFGILAGFFLLGMIGVTTAAVTLRFGGRALESHQYQTALRWYTTGGRVASVLHPFDFYLNGFNSRAPIQADRAAAEGNRLMRNEAWHDAELAYRSVIVLRPGKVNARGNLGASLLKQGKFWEAAACYLDVLAYDPNDLVALYQLAIVRIQLKQFNEATSIVLKMLSLDGVGNAHDLIQGNVLFQLLDRDSRYREAMARYKPGLVLQRPVERRR